jgi:hypothetical protein
VNASRWRSSLAVIPVATVAWLGLGTGAALAAPGAHGPADTSNGAAASADANGGVGQGNGAGNAKHADTTSSAPAATDTSTASAPADSGSATASSHPTAGKAGTSGNPSSTQPLSKADSKGGGANNQCPGGPYCSTRDGSASGNGNGGGKAVGKPCAGCVGKADNKNPKGQNPGGSDHNKGYECDGNNGIGKTNPAHTGCKTPPPACVPPSTLVNGVCTPPETCPEGEHLSNGTCVPDTDCVPTAANNNCTPTTPCTAPAHAGPDGTCVLGEKHTRKPGTTVLGTKTTRLPFTGASVGWMAEGGLAAVSMGTLMLIAGGRRRRQQV